MSTHYFNKKNPPATTAGELAMMNEQQTRA